MMEYGDIAGLDWLWERDYLFSDAGYRIAIKQGDYYKFRWLIDKEVKMDTYAGINALTYNF